MAVLMFVAGFTFALFTTTGDWSFAASTIAAIGLAFMTLK